MTHKNELPTELAKRQLEKINDVDTIVENIESITKAFAEVIVSMYDGKPTLKEGEVFVETISMKILLATRSIVVLTKGVYLETNNKQGAHKLLDFPSINVLTRSILEAYLTLEYLFYNNLDEKEKEFRFKIWRVSGYKSRQNFFDEEDKVQVSEKLMEESKEINILLEQIKEYTYYNDLTKNDFWKLDKYGIPRLNSWARMLENSSLETNKFSTLYKLFSNYAHSEFISLIQMNGADILNLGSEQNSLHLKNALRVVQMIISVSIIQLKNKFKCTSDSYESLELNQRELIQFWNDFAIGKYKQEF